MSSRILDDLEFFLTMLFETSLPQFCGEAGRVDEGLIYERPHDEAAVLILEREHSVLSLLCSLTQRWLPGESNSDSKGFNLLYFRCTKEPCARFLLVPSGPGAGGVES